MGLLRRSRATLALPVYLPGDEVLVDTEFGQLVPDADEYGDAHWIVEEVRGDSAQLAWAQFPGRPRHWAPLGALERVERPVADDVDEQPAPAVLTVDVVLIGERDGQQYVLVIQRRWKPFKGLRALPGGVVNPGETFLNAGLRELEEETSIKVGSMELERVGIYDSPDRDPRGRYVAVAFAARVRKMIEPRAGDDAVAAAWVRVDELLTGGKLAFDHERIIRDALGMEW